MLVNVLSLLVLLGAEVSLGEVVLNSAGYVIASSYQYAGCEGSLETVSAWAIDQCIFSGPAGWPYANTYMIVSAPFVEDDTTWITVSNYYDADCTAFTMNTQVSFDGCTNSGKSTSFYTSNSLPDWSSFDNGNVLQINYNYTGPDNAACSGTQDLVSATWYMNGCIFDCGGGGSHTCQWSGCAAPYGNFTAGGGAGLFQVYTDEGCPAADWESTTVVTSSCSSTITCMESSSSSSDGLSKKAAVGITFAVTFVVMIIIFTCFYFFYLKKRAAADSSLNTPFAQK